MSYLKNFLIYLVPSSLFVYVSYLTWMDLQDWALPIIGISSLLICLAISRFMQGKQNSAKVEQYRILLEYLSSRLAAGHTLEKALLEAFSRLKNELGYKSALGKSLRKLEQSMLAQLDLDRCLKMLKDNFACQSSDAFFDVLPYLNHYGGRLDIFVKQTHRTLNAEIQMQKEIAAEQSAQKGEAIILIFLPFLFSFLLIKQSGSYSASLNQVLWGKLIFAIIFLLSHLAICWTLWIMAQNPQKISTKDIFIRFSEKKKPGRIATLFSQFLLTHLPVKLGYNLSESIRILSRNQPECWQFYNKKKLLLCLFSLLASGLFALAGIINPALVPILLAFIWFIQDLDIIQRKNRLSQQVMIEYPNFLNSMVILLRSGLSLDRSLRLMISSYQANGQSQLTQDLQAIKHGLSVGDSAAFALQEITGNLPQNEISTILQLMARYDREGGKEILEILDVQANTSWQLYRNAMRRRLQSKNMVLLCPMGIDLFLVIVMAMLPAVASLGNINL